MKHKVIIVGAFLAVISMLSAVAIPNAAAQATVIDVSIAPGGLYVGPAVVISGSASAPSGIASVSITVKDVGSGLWVQPDFSLAGAPADIAAFTGLRPPLGDPAVSWRVPLQLGDGTYDVFATAIDNAGSATTAAVQTINVDAGASAGGGQIFVPPNATWRWFDYGAEPANQGPIDWYEVGYSTNGWPSGQAELGYGDGDEATVTYEFYQGEKVITTYFRHSFTIADPSVFDEFTLDILRDDGSVIYINGVEFARSNMPGGNINYNTRADSSSEQTVGYTLPTSSFNAGDNLIAVEVHQHSSTSSDISFQLELTGESTGGAESDAREGSYVLTAGDMAQCSFFGDEAVAEQMDSLWDTDAGIFIGLGDLAYGSGTFQEFTDCFEPSIGRHIDSIWPSPGNHEHYTSPNAAGYRQYFGNAAGSRVGGSAGANDGLWYSFDIDENWHAIGLDSDCNNGFEALPGSSDANGGGCAVGSPQEIWLRADLEANKDKNILAFFHHPPFTANHYSDHEYTMPLWRALTEYGVELTLHGHEHHYERYAQLDYWGDRDPVYGTREFIIGSGGTFPRRDQGRTAPESDFTGFFDAGIDDFGVLQLWLQPDGYEWRWESVFGNAPIDQGSSGLTPAMPTANFVGTVTSGGAVVPGAEVCVTAQRTGVETCTIAASDGSWSIGPIVSDNYTMDTVDPSGGSAPDLNAAVVLAAPTDTTSNVNLGGAVPGDVTCDGQLTIVDVSTTMAYIVGLRNDVASCPIGSVAVDINAAPADVDQSGEIDVSDAAYMMQCVVGIPNPYC